MTSLCYFSNDTSENLRIFVLPYARLMNLIFITSQCSIIIQSPVGLLMSSNDATYDCWGPTPWGKKSLQEWGDKHSEYCIYPL